MSKLRILEEMRRRPRYLPWDVRKDIIAKISNLLRDEKEIIIAVVHGGFISSKIFRDIDIAVYLGHKLPFIDAISYIDKLKDALEESLNIDIALDIQLLDYAPPAFVYKVLSTGQIIVERVSGLASVLKIHAFEDVKRLKKLRGYSLSK